MMLPRDSKVTGFGCGPNPPPSNTRRDKVTTASVDGTLKSRDSAADRTPREHWVATELKDNKVTGWSIGLRPPSDFAARVSKIDNCIKEVGLLIHL